MMITLLFTIKVRKERKMGEIFAQVKISSTFAGENMKLSC